MRYTFPKDASDDTIRRKLRRNNHTDSEIRSYLRGWNSVKNNKSNKDK